MAGPYGIGKASLFEGSGGGLPGDNEVLWFDTADNKAHGSSDLTFNDTLKRLVLGSGAQLYLPTGSVGAPPLTFSADPTTGLYGVTTSLLTGLIGYWKFDEASGTRVDTVGGYNVDAWSGAVGAATGKLNSAATLRSSGNVALIENTFVWTGRAQYSVSSWVYIPSSPGYSTFGAVIGATDTGNQILGFRNSDKAAFLYVNGAYGITAANEGFPLTDTWYHVVAVYDGFGATNADKIKLYVNGVARTLSFPAGTIGTPLSSGTGIQFGRPTPTTACNVNIDETALWNRPLSATEAALLYASGTGTFYDDLGNNAGLNLAFGIDGAKIAEVTADALLPGADATDFLGFSDKRWRSGYFGGAAASVPLVASGHASQTANLQEWRNASGTTLLAVTSAGAIHGPNVDIKGTSGTATWRFGSNNLLPLSSATSNIGGTSNLVKSVYAGGSASTVAFIAVAHATQTANLQEWQNSGGTPLAYVSPQGDVWGKGQGFATVSKTADYTVAAGDHVIRVDASGGNKTITLPAAASHTGRIIHIKKTDASANYVRIDGNGSELVEDATTQDLVLQGENLMLQCDGTGWVVL